MTGNRMKRTEDYFLEGGYGSIDLKGNDFDCIIYFQGKPYALNWCDCSGSVGQILVRSGINGYKKDLRQVRHVVENGLHEEQSISDQIYPILQLFKYGEFKLTNYTPEDWDVSDTKLASQVEYYPFGEVYVPTQAMANLDNETVQKYISKIGTGARPLVITTSVEDGWCEFIIDGHHKMKAYQELKLAPNVLCIEKKNSLLDLDEGLRVLKNKPAYETYKRVKIRYGKS